MKFFKERNTAPITSFSCTPEEVYELEPIFTTSFGVLIPDYVLVDFFKELDDCSNYEATGLIQIRVYNEYKRGVDDLFASVWFDNKPIMIIRQYKMNRRRYVTDPIQYFEAIKHLDSLKIINPIEMRFDNDFVPPDERIPNLLTFDGSKPLYSWWQRFINYKKPQAIDDDFDTTT